MSMQTSTTASDRGKTRQIRSERKKKRPTGPRPPPTPTWRRSGRRSRDGDVPATPPTSSPPQQRQRENSPITKARSVCYHAINTEPRESDGARSGEEHEREEDKWEGEKP